MADYIRFRSFSDPQWAMPIKNLVRDRAQARAVAQVVGALKPTQSQIAEAYFQPATSNDGHPRPGLPPLRVMNGMSQSTITASTNNTADLPSPTAVQIDGLPSPRNTGWPLGANPNSVPLHHTTIFEHPEPSTHVNDESKPTGRGVDRSETVKAIPLSSPPIPPPKPKPINPSLSTLEKAASARIFFENLYFPLLRQPPSREQRRLAMEREMEQMGMNEETRRRVREKWRKTETEYLREQRKKVHASAFKELKTIGHGQ